MLDTLALSSAMPSRLGGRFPRCEADSDVDLLLAGLNCEAAAAPAAAPDDALSRTTRFLTGLVSLLGWLLTGDVGLEDNCELLARVCLLSSPIEATDVFRALRLLTGLLSRAA